MNANLFQVLMHGINNILCYIMGNFGSRERLKRDNILLILLLMMEEFTKRRKLIVEGINSLKGINCSLPGGSFFVFPNVKETGMNGDEFAEKCLNQAGVALIQGTAFGKFSLDNVRINFATSSENISKAIEKIDKILK